MGQSPFITLSWADFQEALKLLSATLSSRSFSCIYGVPRCVLPLAVALSHRLDIPLSLEPAADMLWCDDISMLANHPSGPQASTGNLLRLGRQKFIRN